MALTEPKNGAVVPLLTERHKRFLQYGHRASAQTESIDYLHLIRRSRADETVPQPVRFRWKGGGKTDRLLLSETEDFTRIRVFPLRGGTAYAENLLLDHRYYWCVESDGERSEIFSFVTEAAPPRWIRADRLSNIRDLGGWKTEGGGRIRQGMIYRGCEREDHSLSVGG